MLRHSAFFQGQECSLCLQYVSRKGAFAESRMDIGDLRVIYLLHRKVSEYKYVLTIMYIHNRLVHR
jgi:hypothetical protein